jgi:hypothetical protein
MESLKRVAATEAGQGVGDAQAPAAPAAPGGAMSLDDYLKSKGF